MLELENKILNIPKISSLGDSEKEIVLNLFYRLTKCFDGSRGNLMGGMKVDQINAEILYNTLIEYDYLIDRREKRINDIIEK